MVLVVTANEENASNKKLVALFVFHIRGKQDLQQKRVSHKNKSVLLKHKNVRNGDNYVSFCTFSLAEANIERIDKHTASTDNAGLQSLVKIDKQI